MEAYFDESGTHAGSPFLCVAGYIFESDRCLQFDREWREMLADFRLPFFHRVACEHGDPPFDKLDEPLRRAIRYRAGKIIKNSAAQCFVVSVNPESYKRIVPTHALVGDAYTFCANGCFHAVKVWADELDYPGRISYVFEAGAHHQEQANQIFAYKAKMPNERREYRYQSHAFLMKNEATPLQAADILAWHWADNWKRLARGEFSREEIFDLIDPNSRFWHWDEDQLYVLADNIRNTSAHFPDADPSWIDRPKRGQSSGGQGA